MFHFSPPLYCGPRMALICRACRNSCPHLGAEGGETQAAKRCQRSRFGDVNRRNPRSVQQDANTPICRRNSGSFIARESHAHELLAFPSAYLRLVFSKLLKCQYLMRSPGGKLLRNYSRISSLLPQYRGRTNNPRHLDRVRERRDPPTSFGAYLVIAGPKGAQICRGISPLAPLGRDDVARWKTRSSAFLQDVSP